MTPEQVDKLLDVAGVDRSNEEARWRLGMLPSFLPHPGTKQRPTGRDWNEPLREIAKQAEALIGSLRQLRLHRHQHVDFWGSAQFGPDPVALVNPAPDYHAASVTGLEKVRVLSTLENIAAAAKAAQRQDKGLPPDKRKRRTVEAAADFLQRFRPNALLTGTPTGQFNKFAAAFYEAIHGESANLDRAVRDVAAERSRQN